MKFVLGALFGFLLGNTAWTLWFLEAAHDAVTQLQAVAP